MGDGLQETTSKIDLTTVASLATAPLIIMIVICNSADENNSKKKKGASASRALIHRRVFSSSASCRKFRQKIRYPIANDGLGPLTIFHRCPLRFAHVSFKYLLLNVQRGGGLDFAIRNDYFSLIYKATCVSLVSLCR